MIPAVSFVCFHRMPAYPEEMATKTGHPVTPPFFPARENMCSTRKICVQYAHIGMYSTQQKKGE